ncbi:hypothetical protein ACKVMT_07785 [Halobacteriales archaeon Cl-PHB]
MNRRVATAMRMGAREYRRTPVLLALLAFLPAYIIGAFVWLVDDTPVPVRIDGTAVTVPMSDFAAAFMTPVTAAILSGIVGLFLVHLSQAADGRLRLAGFGAVDLLVSRVGTLAIGSLVVTAASVTVALLAFSPAHVFGFVAATALVGLTYGLLGVVVGLLLDELGGVYVLLFGPMVDVLLFQNPLATDPPGWTAVLPSHFAVNALFEAAFTAGSDAADLFAASAYVLLLFTVALGVFVRVTNVD